MSTYQEEKFPVPTPGRLRRELRLRRPPWWMVLLLIAVVIGTWIPLGIIYQARRTHSELPRMQWFLDMDKQPRFGPQSPNLLFADERAMRQPVEGTIARGKWQADDAWYRGYIVHRDPDSGAESIEFTSTPAELLADPNLLSRGQQQYQIFCAVCHGTTGVGDGPVNQRAIELEDPQWVPASDLLTAEIREQADGQLFQAISDGVRNMPPYRSQISPRDRWAIVAYLRQLQTETPPENEDSPFDESPPSSDQEVFSDNEDQP